jgi:hypothetical protein
MGRQNAVLPGSLLDAQLFLGENLTGEVERAAM